MDRTDKIISDATELQAMQNFITKKIYQMESKGNEKQSEVLSFFFFLIICVCITPYINTCLFHVQAIIKQFAATFSIAVRCHIELSISYFRPTSEQIVTSKM